MQYLKTFKVFLLLSKVIIVKLFFDSSKYISFFVIMLITEITVFACYITVVLVEQLLSLDSVRY